MDTSLSVSIQTNDFELHQANQALEASAQNINQVGAIVSFVGKVRAFSKQNKLSEMYLEHYPGMTEKQLNDILQQAKSRWPIASASIIHRIGTLTPNEQIVYVGVTSAHRKAAFEACEFIMDILKTTATFWKKERFGESEEWVEAKQSDYEQAGKW
ncbi:molybdenum cofactor biosynthesis protein MoaE [Glaciecola sp. KUL10]|uniref:molybdenum cofactor biosynthesis protein MoaE n=1 Tax=Glaciecola sp. (strain KUL10) TaxID=2161813 RepID=UPI000D782632|nr:molybdenum cofactor biosynthesis protein MoaE [Glaciecola sp. KUL10]GBL02807.1 molybdenum cofactor biosynthesis protein E [Glaciecola sp. KUL10]